MSPSDMVVFFLEIAVMLSVGLLLGEIVSNIGFSAIIGELIGGIILGPTVLGWISPGVQSWLFPSAGTVFIGNDLIGWSLFALILSNFTSDSVLDLPSYMTLILALLLFAFIVILGRIVVKKCNSSSSRISPGRAYSSESP